LKGKTISHLQIITTQDEYGTPFETYQQGLRLAKFTPLIDTCSNIFNPKCKLFFTIREDALTKPWDKDFYMNPPYSKIKQFIRYAYEQHQTYNVNGLVLTYAKTDTKWFHKYVQGKAEIHFIEGRIKFLDYYGRPTSNNAPYPSMWVIYRKK
jgi:site-specific DNA-methyltransferase (adenine-specific)